MTQPWHRKCRACKQELPLVKFRVKNGSLHNLDVWCTQCRREKHKTLLPAPVRERRLTKGVMHQSVFNAMEDKVRKSRLKMAENARIQRVVPAWERPVSSANTALKLLRAFPFPEHCCKWRDDMRELIDEALDEIQKQKKRGACPDGDFRFWYDVVPGLRRRAATHVAAYPDGAEKVPFIVL
jgi:hypothetical protein